jgi:chemotaxis protein MotA
MALTQFIDPVAIAIVGGGTLLAVALRTPGRDLVRALAATKALPRRRLDAEPMLRQLAALSRIASRHGVVALDRSVLTDPDMAAAIAAIVDGRSADDVETMVRHARRARIERHAAAADVWGGAADVAPTMGMVGTLVGLARMFSTMNDPSAIGGAMAIALLATLYGALLSTLVFMPVAARLRALGRAEAFERARLEAPLVALARRETPRHHQLGATAAAA